MNFCRFCGSKLEPNAKFCTQCGKSIEENNNINPNNQVQTINYQDYPNSKVKPEGNGFVITAICMFFSSYLLLYINPLMFLLMRIALIGVLVTGLIACPKNTVIKVLFWIYVVILIIDIILIIIVMMTCYNMIHLLDGCYSGN